MHGHGHKTENVLDPATDLRLSAVIFFLFLGQGLVAAAFLTYLVTDVLGQLFADVSTVSVPDFVLLAEKILKLVAIVYVGRGDGVIQYQLAIGINLDVILVAVMLLVTFLRPTSIGVFLRQLMWLVFPFLGNFTVLDLFVFITAVSLTRCINKGCVYDRSFMRDDSSLFKHPFKLCKQNIYDTEFGQGVLE